MQAFDHAFKALALLPCLDVPLKLPFCLESLQELLLLGTERRVEGYVGACRCKFLQAFNVLQIALLLPAPFDACGLHQPAKQCVNSPTLYTPSCALQDAEFIEAPARGGASMHLPMG